MVLAIVGSAKLAANQVTEARQIVRDLLRSGKPSEVVSGGASGVDTIAREEADAAGIPCREFLPEVRRWDGGSRVGFKQRNQQIVDYCTTLVRIITPETTTYGSGWTRDRAVEQNKDVREIRLQGATP